MQHTLTFVKDKVKYVSKPFDFEAMCIINDAHNDENKKGPLSICRDALDYMFEGTDATQDVMSSVIIRRSGKWNIGSVSRFSFTFIPLTNGHKTASCSTHNPKVLAYGIGI